MHLVQILLPLYDNDGRRFPTSHYESLRAELTERFGGLTSYSRAPARRPRASRRAALTNRERGTWTHWLMAATPPSPYYVSPRTISERRDEAGRGSIGVPGPSARLCRGVRG